MTSSSEESDRDPPAPFLVNLFYRTGAFHRADDFVSPSSLSHVSIYAWPESTLSELAMDLAAAKASALPYPAIGTRIVFQLVYPDLRGASKVNNAPPKFSVKDLGSVVIGQGGPGAVTEPEPKDDEHCQTLADARFVAGDFLSCAILPPLADASVAPASTARKDLGSVHRDGRGSRNAIPRRVNGVGRDGGYPVGEWRRGEALPHLAPPRP